MIVKTKNKMTSKMIKIAMKMNPIINKMIKNKKMITKIMMTCKIKIMMIIKLKKKINIQITCQTPKNLRNKITIKITIKKIQQITKMRNLFLITMILKTKSKIILEIQMNTIINRIPKIIMIMRIIMIMIILKIITNKIINNKIYKKIIPIMKHKITMTIKMPKIIMKIKMPKIIMIIMTLIMTLLLNNMDKESIWLITLKTLIWIDKKVIKILRFRLRLWIRYEQ